MKHFLSVQSCQPKDLVQQALQLKAQPWAYESLGKRKTLGLLFLNPSLRTRLSTQKAAAQLGLNTMVMNLSQDGWNLELGNGMVMDQGASEHVKEAAQVMGQYCDIVGIRCFPGLQDASEDYRDELIGQFIEYSGRPVISLESCTRHPLQSLADMMTIEECRGTNPKPKVVLSWAPHAKPLPQAVANSFVEWATAFDCDLTITHPKGYELAGEFSSLAPVCYNQDQAFENADFIYCKNWSSYTSYGKIIGNHRDWMITLDKMKRTNQAKFMHCLPIRRNLVAADDVLDSNQSVVIQQAHNRIFAAQAVLKNILETQQGVGS
ncbi:N-acetylornithine carbamoyltransferase [Pseudobacteriovorax antillogorgiicola]|uniref:N-succinylornithine carbamoyltransferase n=1 Tax=Pseudobacteriovorax antillogorgiicola TaxID=1513793 RepID=A0A1Y6C7K0_9BACT|nr:N-acetylornithine carbamoyltransferase [Pseudobacteriovorax antillogorgiicola]TCS51686.1 ornithine carbamoyltransferase [Pseudobacteriovorax antillogorgiicola]SMF49084.1 ornithine carbamoyltransferase [Pseudobacteriovorax antillogorgiicola]